VASIGHSLQLAMHSQFLIQVLDMVAHCHGADAQLPGAYPDLTFTTVCVKF
jgi:hypothetical protein